MGWITWTLYRLPESRDGSLFYHIQYDKSGWPHKRHSFWHSCEQGGGYPSLRKEDQLTIPEKYCPFITMDGNHLSHYFKDINGGFGTYMADVPTILKTFPTWESIKDSDDWAKHGWDETKHNLFKECLEWCAAQGRFVAMWPA